MSQQSSSDPSKEENIRASRLSSPREEQSITPQLRPENSSYFAAAGSSSPPYISPYAQITETQAGIPTDPMSQHTSPRPSTSLNPELQDLPLTDSPAQTSMSTYSSSSESSSVYDSPNPQRYRGTIGMMSAPKEISAVSI